MTGLLWITVTSCQWEMWRLKTVSPNTDTILYFLFKSCWKISCWLIKYVNSWLLTIICHLQHISDGPFKSNTTSLGPSSESKGQENLGNTKLAQPMGNPKTIKWFVSIKYGGWKQRLPDIQTFFLAWIINPRVGFKL